MKDYFWVTGLVIILSVSSVKADDQISVMQSFCEQEEKDLAHAESYINRGVQSEYWVYYRQARLENLKICQGLNTAMQVQKSNDLLMKIAHDTGAVEGERDEDSRYPEN